MLNSFFKRFRAATGQQVVALTVSCATTGVPSKDNPEYTHIVWHRYDEVFQASMKAIERAHFFVTASDKHNGTITGTATANSINTFEIHINALNTKEPETQVTFVPISGKWFGSDYWPAVSWDFFRALLGVLSGEAPRASGARLPPPSSGTQVSPVAPPPAGAGSYTSPSCIGHGIGCQ